MTDKPQAATIWAAIPRAMGEMKRLAKDNKNTEQKYDFASVDDFLAMTGPILAKHGLFIIMDEASVENFERQGKYGVTHWAKYTFTLTVAHESGATLAPATRSVEVIRSGAQAAGSAQSYVLKQFQRALFNIPTGDKDDPDFAEKADGAPVKTDPAAAHEKAVTEAIDRLTIADTLDELRHVFTGLPKPIAADPRVIKAKDARKDELTPTPDNDMGDDIPEHLK